jgi:hypothetical protein
MLNLMSYSDSQQLRDAQLDTTVGLLMSYQIRTSLQSCCDMLPIDVVWKEHTSVTKINCVKSYRKKT